MKKAKRNRVTTPESWDYFREAGLREIRLLRKHLPLTGYGENIALADSISPAQVKSFYKEYLASVRPQRLGLDKILPKPDPLILRGLYIGNPDANTLLNLIVRHALYMDQIVVFDPFQDPLYLKGDGDILIYPEKWVEEVANRALCLCAIQDWVERGIVLISPQYSYYFPEKLERAVEKLSESGFQIPVDPGMDDRFNVMVRLFVQQEPDERDSLFQVFEKMGFQLSTDEKADFLDKVEIYESKNPIRFRLPKRFYSAKNFPSGHFGQIINYSNGIALPLAYPIAEATGSFLLFENQALYDTLSDMIKAKVPTNDPFEKLGLAFQKLDFEFLNNVPLSKALEFREQGYLKKFRIYLRDLWMTASSAEAGNDLDIVIRDFIDRLTIEYSDLKKEWEKINSDLRTNAVIKGMVAGLTTVAASGQLNLTMGAVAGLGVSILTGLSDYQSYTKDRSVLEKNPLAVFIKLQ